MRKKHFSILLLLSFFVFPIFAQDIMVSGTVMDASDSEALIGVSVVVKGTTNGAITDIDGRYSLSVPSGGTLLFTYIGYKTEEVIIRDQTTVNVSLSNNMFELSEVVVVGTIMRKSDLTGAVSSVSTKVLEERPVTDVNQALQGRVAGVLINSAAKPGDVSSIRIRGINTIDGATDPIYVVDGLVMDNGSGGFNAVNLNDVASIEVLKDASSTALYGSRAANGVVLITTKKGQKGIGRVSYDGWVGVRSYANMPKTMNSRQLFDLRRDAALNFYNQKYPNATRDDINSFINDRIMTAYNPAGGGGYVFGQYELDAYANPNFKDYDWMDEVTRNAVEQNHTINFSGGSDAGSFYLSFGYSDQEGMVKNLDNKRYTGRINADYNVKPWLKVGTNTSFVRQESNIIDNDDVFDKARGANPMLPIDYDLLTLNYGDFFDQNYFNPLQTMRIDNNRTRNRLISSNFLNITFMKGLNFRTSFLVNLLEESRFRYTPNDIQQAIRYTHNGEAVHTRDNRLNWQLDNSLSYDNTFEKHRVNALIGTSMSKTNFNYTSATGRGFDNNILSYYNLEASNQTTNRSISSDFTASTLMSYITRANYVYDNKYYFTATARYDGSSKFADDYKWGLFPSFSAAWNITEEEFMSEQEIFDQLKFRVGYGLVGNQEIGDYAYLTLYKPSAVDGSTTYVPDSKKGTRDISWESQRSFNVGFDMAFFKNRLRFSADYFNIVNHDLLITRTINETSGFKTAVVNAAEIENHGFEFSIDVTPVKTRDFEWNVAATFSSDKNKITGLYDDNEYILNYNADYGNLEKEGNFFIGKPRNGIYILKYGGIAQEEDMERLNQIDWRGRNVNPGDLYPLDISGPDGTPDGKITDDDYVFIASDPKFYGGFSTDLTYKGIGLNAVFTYSYGAKRSSYLYNSTIGSTGRGLASTDLLDRWSPENTGAKYPRPIYPDPSESFSYSRYGVGDTDMSVQDASYLRLSTLTLSYTLPKAVVNNLKLANLRLYTTVSNVFCLTDYKGYDPETGDWYPPTRLFVFGCNISF